MNPPETRNFVGRGYNISGGCSVDELFSVSQLSRLGPVMAWLWPNGDNEHLEEKEGRVWHPLAGYFIASG